MRRSITLRTRQTGPFLEAVLEGVPEGMTISGGYVSNQLWRVRCALSGRLPGRPPELVRTGRRRRLGKASARALLLRIAERDLGPRARRPLTPNSAVTLEALAAELAALTVVRKALEDRKLFVGSRVLDPLDRTGGRLEVEGLGRLLAASCGAYKVTEHADRSRSRVIAFGTRRDGSRRSFRPPKAFELLVSGPSGWTRLAARPETALGKSLAGRILSNGLIASVSTSGSLRGSVEVVRLRAVLKERALRDSPKAASLCSVLAETAAVAELAVSVMGWQIRGLSESGLFGSEGRDELAARHVRSAASGSPA